MIRFVITYKSLLFVAVTAIIVNPSVSHGILGQMLTNAASNAPLFDGILPNNNNGAIATSSNTNYNQNSNVAVVQHYNPQPQQNIAGYGYYPNQWVQTQPVTPNIVSSGSNNNNMQTDQLNSKSFTNPSTKHETNAFIHFDEKIQFNANEMLTCQVIKPFNIPSNHQNLEVNTAPSGKNDIAYAYFPIRPGQKCLSFKVRADKNAYITISDQANRNCNRYVIALGETSAPTKPAVSRILRKVTSEELSRVQTPNIISGNEFRSFWLSWCDNEVKFGRGGEMQPFLRFPDANMFEIKYFGISSADVAGAWIFEEPKCPGGYQEDILETHCWPQPNAKYIRKMSLIKMRQNILNDINKNYQQFNMNRQIYNDHGVLEMLKGELVEKFVSAKSIQDELTFNEIDSNENQINGGSSNGFNGGSSGGFNGGPSGAFNGGVNGGSTGGFNGDSNGNFNGGFSGNYNGGSTGGLNGGSSSGSEDCYAELRHKFFEYYADIQTHQKKLSPKLNQLSEKLVTETECPASAVENIEAGTSITSPTTVTSFPIPTPSCFSISIRSGHDTRITLFEDQPDSLKVCIELGFESAINVWENKMNTKTSKTYTPGLIRPNEFRKFWISWNAEKLMVGREDETQAFLTTTGKLDFTDLTRASVEIDDQTLVDQWKLETLPCPQAFDPRISGPVW